MQTSPLSEEALRHGLDYEPMPSLSEPVMPRKRILAPGQKNPRFNSWIFEILRENCPVFKPPMVYLGYYQRTPDILSGVVYFKAQVTNVIKHIPDSFNHIALPGRSVNEAVDQLRLQIGVTEFGTPPMTRAVSGGLAKKRYANALRLAREGRFHEIEDDLRVRYLPSFELEYKRHQLLSIEDDYQENKLPSLVAAENTLPLACTSSEHSSTASNSVPFGDSMEELVFLDL